jgi:hypothetical protein
MPSYRAATKTVIMSTLRYSGSVESKRFAITRPFDLHHSEDARALRCQHDTCHLHPRHRGAIRGLFLIRLLTRLSNGVSAALPRLLLFPLFAGLS